MHEVVRWILRQGPKMEQHRFTLELAERLHAHASVARLFTATLSLHPVTHGLGTLWRDDGTCEMPEVGWDIFQGEEHHQSPISYVMDEAKELRVRLDGGPYAFPLLDQFEAEGMSEWLGLPMELDTWTGVLALSTRRPDGFSSDQLSFLRDVADALTPVMQVLALRRTATGILDTYLGPHAGERVWKGKIRQGDGDDIHAVIWFCDLRRSTPLAEALPRPVFLALLDQFFGAMGGAIQDSGGEVLRYIGDAVLAIFPIDDPSEPGAAVEAAMRAARDASARLTEINAARSAAGDAPLEYGIGLHLGDVMYGNIGTPTRLEFSVIGAAANEAARVESMCKELGRSVILSDAVASHAPDQVEALGAFRLRGVSREIALFALEDA